MPQTANRVMKMLLSSEELFSKKEIKTDAKGVVVVDVEVVVVVAVVAVEVAAVEVDEVMDRMEAMILIINLLLLTILI